MINTRKIAALGIGFGALAIATIGLLGDLPPVDNQPSGGGSGGAHVRVSTRTPAKAKAKAVAPKIIHTITVPAEMQDDDEELIIAMVLAEYYRWRAV